MKKRKVLNLVAVLFGALAGLLGFSARWMFHTWNKLTMDELVFHIKAPLEGTNNDMIKEYILVCVVPTLVLILVLCIFLKIFRQRNRQFLGGKLIIGISIVFTAGLLFFTWNKLDVGTYLADQKTDSTFIEENYVDPNDVSLTFPEQKRNLIYIFLESMEMTYSDQSSGGAFEKNVIPLLTQLAQENEDFSGSSQVLNGAHALNGATWTMGAMFAHTSGLPLNLSINDNDMDTQDSFFPGITTIGDILKEQGYNQELLLGSNAKFGGRKLYFSDHGDYMIHDYNYAKKQGLIDKDYKVWWGYEDEKLFAFAKDDLTELAKKDEPFNLTMLTVDTHFEDGYVCDQCEDNFDVQYANVMKCSSKQVSEFVAWVKEQDFYDNTTIVIAGDHLTMDSDFLQNIDADYDERIYTAFINAPVTVKKMRKEIIRPLIFFQQRWLL